MDRQANLADTHPVRVQRKRSNGWFWLLGTVFTFGMMISLGSIGGYVRAYQEFTGRQAAFQVQSLKEQYDLGVQELQSGQYDRARQRFEYILTLDPAYPGAADRLVEAMQVLYATATPTPPPPTATLTPTPDLRPAADLLAQAQAAFSQEDWNGVIDLLISLRMVDPQYEVSAVDGMLYLVLRNRGVAKILQESNLEGGIYDLSLAERFGPLDKEASQARQVARLYEIGSSFWEAIPEQAVYYFGQAASAAPYLRDASGWTAAQRYRAALIQYGDWLAKNGSWCEAEDQYNLAISYSNDADVLATADYAAIQCSPPTDTPEPEAEVPTQTPTATAPVVTETQAPEPTLTEATATPELPTDTPAADTAAPPTETPQSGTETPAPPSETPMPTEAAPSTATPEPPTETPAPPTEEPSTEAPPPAELPATVEATTAP